MGHEIIRVKEVKELSGYYNDWLIFEDVQVAKNDGRHSGEQEDLKPDTENCIWEREVDTVWGVHN